MASITKKIVRGKPYYYLRECQRVNGKPKVVSTIYLGSAQSIRERLLCPQPAEVTFQEFGGSAAAFSIAQTLDVVATVDRHVPKRGHQGPSVGQYLLLAALNRCVAPTSKAQIGSWYAKTVLRRLLPLTAQQLSSQRFWDNMERVNTEQIAAMEQDLAHNAVSRFGLDLRCLLFDATNFFTFLDSFNLRPKLPQRGHGKQGHDNLRLLGLAVMATADGDVPLLHHTYAGNQHDSVMFYSVAEQLFARCRAFSQEVDQITLVFDKGNNSEATLRLVDQGPLHFVGSLVPTYHPDVLAIPRPQMRRLDRSQLPAVWAYRTQKQVFAVNRTVLVTFNQKLFRAQQKTLTRNFLRGGATVGTVRCSRVSVCRRRSGLAARGMACCEHSSAPAASVCWRGREEEGIVAIYAAVTGTSRYPLARARAWSEARVSALRFCSNLAAPRSTHACPLVIRRYTSTPR